MTQLVFVPVTRPEAQALRSGADLGVRAGYAATPSLTRAAGPDAVPEEVEYAALSYAGEAARTLESGRPGLVLAVDVDPAQVSDEQTDRGEVTVADLTWPQVQSLFADEPEAEEDVDLLWFGVEELDEL